MTTALEGGEGSASRLGRSLPQERPCTHCTGGYVGPRAGLDGRKTSPHRDLIPGPCNPLLSHYTDWANRPTTAHHSDSNSLASLHKRHVVLNTIMFSSSVPPVNAVNIIFFCYRSLSATVAQFQNFRVQLNPARHYISYIRKYRHTSWSKHTPLDVTSVGSRYIFQLIRSISPYPTAFPYGNGMVLHFYQQQESSTTKTVHKVINKGLKTYV